MTLRPRTLQDQAATPTATSTPGSRQSKRVKASTDHTPAAGGTGKSTPGKSKYFEGPGSDDSEGEDRVQQQRKEEAEASSSAEDAAEGDDASGYEEASASATSASASAVSSEDDEEDYDADEAPKRRRGQKRPAVGRGRPAGKVGAAAPATTVGNDHREGQRAVAAGGEGWVGAR